MKEVLHRRCVCRQACARPRRAVHSHFRRMAAAGRRTAIRKGEVATRPLMFSSTRTPALLYCHDGNKNVSDMVTIDGMKDIRSGLNGIMGSISGTPCEDACKCEGSNTL